MRKGLSCFTVWVLVLTFLFTLAPVGIPTAKASGHYPVGEWGLSGEITSGDYVYNVISIPGQPNYQLFIVDYKGPGGHVTVPAELDGLPVVCIYVDAFGDHDDITEITISEGIKYLGWDWLTGNSVFNGCDNLAKITIPSTMNILNGDVFGDCPKLDTLVVNGPGALLKSVDNVIYTNEDQPTLIAYAPGKADESYTVSDGTLAIDDNVFYSAKLLKAVTLPASVKRVGKTNLIYDIVADDIFPGCTGLQSVAVDDANTVFSSENGVLYDKDKTKLLYYPEAKTDSSFAIPATVTSVVLHAFVNIPSLVSVQIPAALTEFRTSVTNEPYLAREHNPFAGSAELAEISVDPANANFTATDGVLFSKDGTKLISYPPAMAAGAVPAATLQAAQDQYVTLAAGLTGNFTVPETVMKIGSQAFSGCSLATVTILGRSTELGYDVFNNTKGIIICGYFDSIAQGYADSMYIPFVDITSGRMPAPTLKAVSASYNSIRISRGDITGRAAGDGFEVQQKIYGKYKYIASVAGTEYILTGLSMGKTYTFRIRAYLDQTPVIYSYYSKDVSVKVVPAAPAKPTAQAAAYNKVTVTWNKVEGASKYELWRGNYDSHGKLKFKLVKTTSGLSFTDTVHTGFINAYKVRGIATVKGKKVEGAFSLKNYCTAYLGVPADFKAERASAASVKISFTKVPGAYKYVIYRQIMPAGTMKALKTISGTYYTDQGLTTGQAYKYQVRAYRIEKESKIYSPYTAAITVTP